MTIFNGRSLNRPLFFYSHFNRSKNMKDFIKDVATMGLAVLLALVVFEVGKMFLVKKAFEANYEKK